MFPMVSLIVQEESQGNTGGVTAARDKVTRDTGTYRHSHDRDRDYGDYYDRGRGYRGECDM